MELEMHIYVSHAFLTYFFPIFFTGLCAKKKLHRLYTDQEESTDTGQQFVTPQIQWFDSRSLWADAQEY